MAATKRVSELSIHPINRQIYGEPDPGDLTTSLEEFGLRYPLEIDRDNQVLSGARRLAAARELGWEKIEVEVLEIGSQDAARQEILLANAYRPVKSVYIRQKEADAYKDLLERGHVTHEDLARMAEQQDLPVTRKEHEEPTELSARAAGISSSTYSHAKYVTDESRGEADIDEATSKGEISDTQAKELKRQLQKDREDFEKDKIGARSTARSARERLRRAREQHGYSPEEKKKQAAIEAADDAIRKGESFVSACRRLAHSEHAKRLGPQAIFVLAGHVAEAHSVLSGLANKAGVSLPESRQEIEQALEEAGDGEVSIRAERMAQ